MSLDRIQQLQEDDYRVPYHWFDHPDTTKRRISRGYNELCFMQAETLPREALILDAGCGDGRFLGHLHDRGFSKLSGCDYSRRALDFAALLIPFAHLEYCDLTESVPFPQNSFDMIFLIEALEHIHPSKVPTVLQHLADMLKEGGRLVITVPSVLQGMAEESKHYQHFSVVSLNKEVQPFLTISDILGQDKAGFHPLKVFSRLLDNPHWCLKRLTRWYNTTIWPRYFNRCRPEEGRRLIMVAEKTKNLPSV